MHTYDARKQFIERRIRGASRTLSSNRTRQQRGRRQEALIG